MKRGQVKLWKAGFLPNQGKLSDFLLIYYSVKRYKENTTGKIEWINNFSNVVITTFIVLP